MDEIVINPKINILIVDDKYENLLALEGVLENPDLNIIRAMSGNEALAKLVENDFALVLLDVQMPDMDGFETAKLMRGIEKTKYIPIIFITAISKEQKYIFKGYEAGAVDYIFKPIDADILKSKVKIFVDLFKQKKELEEINLELSTLYKLTSAISKTIDFDKLTNSIVDVIIKNKLLDVLNKAIFFIVENDKLIMKSYYGVSDELARFHNNIKIGECLCGLAAQTGEIIISGNSATDPKHTINIENPHGHIIIPVNDSKGICGVVCLYTPINIKIGGRKVQLLKTIGTQLGIDIEKSKIYEETKSLSLHDELT
ncbi:response regulator [Candidatus Poribacteria bacterium]|nr:response regulator [Candidatus Poribacteria bacterium]